MLIKIIYEKYNKDNINNVKKQINKEYNTDMKFFLTEKIDHIFPINLEYFIKIITFLFKINHENRHTNLQNFITINENRDIFSNFSSFNNKLYSFFHFNKIYYQNNCQYLNIDIDLKNYKVYNNNEINNLLKLKKINEKIWYEIQNNYMIYDNFLLNNHIINYFKLKNKEIKVIDLIKNLYEKYTKKIINNTNNNKYTFTELNNNNFLNLNNFNKICYDFKFSKVTSLKNWLLWFNKFTKNKKMNYDIFYKTLIEISKKKFKNINSNKLLKYLFLYLNIKSVRDMLKIFNERNYKYNFSNDKSYNIEYKKESINYNKYNLRRLILKNNNIWKKNIKYSNNNINKLKSKNKNYSLFIKKTHNLKNINIFKMVKNSYFKQYNLKQNRDINLNKISWSYLCNSKLNHLGNTKIFYNKKLNKWNNRKLYINGDIVKEYGKIN